MHFTQNIKLLRRRKGFTQEDMARLLNMKRPTLGGYESGVAKPGIGVLIAYSDFFKVSIDTLIRIDLGKLPDSQLRQLEQGNDVFVRGSQLRVLATTVDKNNRENIELVPEKAKAGYTTGFADPEYISELPRFSLPFLPDEKKFRTFQISGDSMLPIAEGSWVTGEYIQDWTSIKDGQACIVLTVDDGVIFKILENKWEQEGSFLAKSLNPMYEPYLIPIIEIKEIWKFTHFISSAMPEEDVSVGEIMKSLKKLQEDVAVLKDKG
ncbi:MAG: LexA family transcriptional regulator [Bacteroidales bacterium]|nr:LexA family transcriptional regulator [Bacteroidales bacterium]MCF8455085.1 LexA family transcriptional regulator [Bacteroidales bacterium]